MKYRILFGLACCLLVLPCLAAASNPVRRTWDVDGVAREALVCAPTVTSTNGAPLIFVFHGHGGTMQHAARTFALHTLWPEALVVYPQGLKTPGQITDPEGKQTGWQPTVGSQGGRDLKFFDAMLGDLKKDYRVDGKRIFATGHSNGGAFCYLLWAVRGEQFAAFAPSAAATLPLLAQLKPKPALHLAAENDPLVKYAWQLRTIEAVKHINQCGEGRPWGIGGTLYSSKIGNPVVTFIHQNGHQFPAEAPAAIVKFFQSISPLAL
jgi:polyhydroxybutyrate depolymerase